MRVALFSDALPPRIDGVAVTVGRIARELARREHDVAVIGPGAFADVDGASVHVRLPALPMPGFPGLRASLPSLGRKATSALDRLAPDLVHVLTEMPVGVAGRRWAIARGVPLVTSAHTDYPAYLGAWGFPSASTLMGAWLAWFHREAWVTLAPSIYHARTLRRLGHVGSLRIWGRGVDGDLFDPRRRSLRFRAMVAPRGEKIVLTVGRVVPEKRIDRLIDAFDAAISQRQDAVLVVVGEGSARAALERRAPAGVRFVGPLRGVPLAEAYASSDLFATASEDETFGNAVLEAMASGLPVIVPRAGALVELVDASCGLVYERGELALAMRSALDAGAWRGDRGLTARRAALTRSWSCAMDELLAGYEGAL